jgi:peptidyl-prolyl cis-trans isomerase D
MLQSIRDRAQGIVVWTIVGLIIITFALFGLSSYLSGTAQSFVATVNGVEISERDLLREYQNAQRRLQQMLGANYRADLFNEEIMKQQVLEGLIQRELINQELEAGNYQVAPEQIIASLQQIPAFHDANGNFSAENYRRVLSVQGMPSELFEMQLALDIANEQLRNAIVRSTFVTEQEGQRYQRLQEQQRKVGYLRLPQQRYLEKIKISADEVSSYYEQNAAEFSTPQEVGVDYVELNLADMARQIDFSEAEIKDYYDHNQQSYISQSEQRKVRHILIPVNATNDEQQARQRIEELAARIKNGEDFATVAKAESEDPGSASQGGDLGFIDPGVMDKAFEQATLQLGMNELSQPIRTRFGYHLIEVTDIRPVQLQPFDEVKAQIRIDLQTEQAEKRFFEEVDKLNNLSYEVPDSLEPAADQLGLEIKHSPMFTTAGGQAVFSNPKVISASFSDEVLSLNRNSELIELSDTHVLVLRLREHKVASQRPLDEVRDIIVGRLKQQQAREMATKDAGAALERLAESEDPKRVATDYQQKWQDAGFIKRSPPEGDKLDNQIREAIFSLPHPQDNRPELTSLTLAGGDAVVLALYAVQDGEITSDKAGLQTVKQQLANMSGQIEYNAFLAYLQSKADITRNLQPSEE